MGQTKLTFSSVPFVPSTDVETTPYDIAAYLKISLRSPKLFIENDDGVLVEAQSGKPIIQTRTKVKARRASIRGTSI